MTRPRQLLPLVVMVLAVGHAVASGADPAPDPAGTEFFEKEVRPLLVARCPRLRSGGPRPALELPAPPRPRASPGQGRRLAPDARRSVPPGRPGGEGPVAGARGRQADPDSPPHLRPDRLAADSGRDRGIP